ncbi:site-specific integrase [Burkholderia pseudomallei]|uniref:site-specific integrase n=1 Tax=Burkholderia pseudomallei TaxID=28450 RepID=UPI0021804B02|nr:site-specific integrase [Burkholderia pseudomallei]
MMARLEHIRYEFFDGSLGERGELLWGESRRPFIDDLPQIFWADGYGWHEANLWALDRVASREVHSETVKRAMKHLARFANFLESNKIDWRHFPVRREDQVLRRFRKRLIDERQTGVLAGSTVSNCMSTIVQFYRFANLHDLVGATAPMWRDRLAVLPFYDTAGFKRTVVRLSSDLAISNNRRPGDLLEDGLMPLRQRDMTELLAFSARRESIELHLMLCIGFFTGARIGTITTLTVTSLQTSREDPSTPGIYQLAVGPGTGIATKFSVSGAIMVPQTILDDLRTYAVATRRLLREGKAQSEHKDLLFLTRSAQPYTVDTVDRLVNEMRKRAVSEGMRFMENFKFHQTRATFGTWLMQLLLENGAKTDAIRVVRDAMLHKHERTTLGYIRFLENSRAKQQLAAAFNEAFTGFRKPGPGSEHA